MKIELRLDILTTVLEPESCLTKVDEFLFSANSF